MEIKSLQLTPLNTTIILIACDELKTRLHFSPDTSVKKKLRSYRNIFELNEFTKNTLETRVTGIPYCGTTIIKLSKIQYIENANEMFSEENLNKIDFNKIKQHFDLKYKPKFSYLYEDKKTCSTDKTTHITPSLEKDPYSSDFLRTTLSINKIGLIFQYGYIDIDDNVFCESDKQQATVNMMGQSNLHPRNSIQTLMNEKPTTL